MRCNPANAVQINWIILSIGSASGSDDDGRGNGILQNFFIADFRAPVSNFRCRDLLVRFEYIRKICMFLDQGPNIVKLLHYLQILVGSKRYSRRMRGEGSQFVSQNTIDGGNRYRQIIALCQQQIIFDFFLYKLLIVIIFKKDVKQNVEFLFSDRGKIGEFEMPLFNIVLSDTNLFLVPDKRKYTGRLFYVAFHICYGSDNDIDVRRQPHYLGQKYHQTASTLKNKAHPCLLQSFQQSQRI